MIEVNHLVKNYNGHPALCDISFQVKQGQIIGLLGPNGAGKSTTMNILTGYLSATEGKVMIQGYDMIKDPVKAKKYIGYLPEIPPLYEDMTVEEYLLFVCELKKIKGKEAKKEEINRVMEDTRIEEKRGRLIRSLSKGYKQRVGLAQALLGNPPILILDEPTVGLDPSQIVEMRSLIHNLAGKHTIIFSSHILSEVNEICDYLIIIDQGKIVAKGTPEELSTHLSARNVLYMDIKGEKEKIEEILKEIDYVVEYTITQKQEIVSVRLTLEDDVDHGDDLFFVFAQERMPVTRMEKESLSLEEVFMKLTTQVQEEEKEDESNL